MEMEVLQTRKAFENLKEWCDTTAMLEICFDLLSYDKREQFIETVAYDLNLEPKELIA